MTNVTLTSAQWQAFELLKPVTDINLPWGRGCGKSWFLRFVSWFLGITYSGKSRLELLEQFGMTVPDEDMVPQNLRGLRIVWLMPTLKQFKAVHGPAFREEAGLYENAVTKTNWTDYRIELTGGGWIQPFPADLHNSQASRGIRCDVVIADECDDIQINVFDSIVKPWFSEPWSLKIRITGGTPRQGRHGLLYQRHVLGKDPKLPRYNTIHSTYRDCPEIVSLEEVLDTKETTIPEVFRREWECDFDAAEGRVYPFDENFHVRDPGRWATFNEYIVGVDHGYNDPGVFILCGIRGHGKDAEVWILNEIYQTQKVESWWLEQAKSWSLSASGTDRHVERMLTQKTIWAVDKSMPARITAFNFMGLNAMGAENSITPGIDRVADLLFRRQSPSSASEERIPSEDTCRLFVHPRCVNTIAEFNAYKRKSDPRDADKYMEQPEDRNNHAMDALRYAMITRFGPMVYGKTETQIR